MKRKNLLKSLILLFALVVGISNVWADEVTYTVTSKTSVSTSGTAPEGSSATYSQTYNTACQATKDNSLTLTLSGYEGHRITGITLSMKSNASKGAGSLSVVAGSTTIANITDSKFNTANWYGAWSTSYVDIEVSMTNDSYGIQEDEDVTITIAASENSLYCQSFTISYETDDDKTPTTITINASGINNNMYGDNNDGGVIAATIKAGETTVAGSVSWSSKVASVATINASSGAITLVGVGTTTITASFEGNEDYKPSTGTYNLTVINVNPNKTTIWSEDFSRYKTDDKPSGGIYSYSCTNGGTTTKVYEEYYAGGSSPELLISKSNGSFIATIPLGYCCSGDLTLTFLTNNTNIAVSSTTDGVSVTGDIVSGANTVTISDVTTEMENLVIVFSNSYSSNVRLDNIVLKSLVEIPVNGSNEITNDVTIPYGATSNVSSVIIPSNKTLTINGILNVTGTITNNGDAGHLVINDGGQLITTSAVSATVKHSIDAVPTKDDVYGWYTISSPVNGVNITDNTNLLDNTYNILRYNEEEMVWENYGNPAYSSFGNTLENGRGYLYRNSDDITLEYSGTINNSTVAYTVTKHDVEYEGFNLIGNPYTHDIYKGTGGAVPNTGASGYELANGFYTLTKAAEWHACEDNVDAIKSGQGFLVKATTGGEIVMSNVATGGPAKGRANHDNIKFVVENNQYSDVAYAVFDKGYGLNKINHRNPNSPMIYIPRVDDNYAIAMMNDDTKSFDLNFKAMIMGQYTLSLKANGMFDYIHLIDRLTGKDIDMLLEGKYTFIGTPSDSDNRFIVKLAYNTGNTSSMDESFAYQSGNDIYVTGSGELQIFDITGRQVMATTISSTESINLSAKGVFIFRLIGNDVKTQKIVVE